MVFNTTFNNISIISWWSVLLVEETGGPWENHRPVASQWQNSCHIMLYTSPWSWFELLTSMMIGTDCIGSYKSNCHMITATISCKSWYQDQGSDIKRPCYGLFIIYLAQENISGIWRITMWYRLQKGIYDIFRNSAIYFLYQLAKEILGRCLLHFIRF
jgi:hypothetical protein